MTHPEKVVFGGPKMAILAKKGSKNDHFWDPYFSGIGGKRGGNGPKQLKKGVKKVVKNGSPSRSGPPLILTKNGIFVRNRQNHPCRHCGEDPQKRKKWKIDPLSTVSVGYFFDDFVKKVKKPHFWSLLARNPSKKTANFAKMTPFFDQNGQKWQKCHLGHPSRNNSAIYLSSKSGFWKHEKSSSKPENH